MKKRIISTCIFLMTISVYAVEKQVLTRENVNEHWKDIAFWEHGASSKLIEQGYNYAWESIWDDDNVEIEANNISWKILKKAGFNVKNKGEFRKIVKTNELTEFHSIKEDLLEEAKQDFDEINKS